MVKIVRVKVPATTANLGPGFDVLGAALSLYNELEVRFDPRGRPAAEPFIVIEGEGEGSLPRDASNIVWRSMQSVFALGGEKISAGSLRLRLINRIPLASGLGSSAAARLCGILAASTLLKKPLSPEEIVALGVRLEGHPDNIVPALAGGLCIAYCDNGAPEFVTLAAPRLSAVVCTPAFELSTRRARRVLPKKVAMPDVIYNASRLALLIAAFGSEQHGFLSAAMEDRLHQPRRARLIPGMYEIFAAAKKAGAFGAALSGAGPSIIALCPSGCAGAVGKKMQGPWRKRGIESRCFILGFDPRGAQVTITRH